MKLYNHWIKFNKLNGEYSRTDSCRSSYVTDRKLAEERMEKDIEWCNSGSKWLVVADYGICEIESNGVITLEGMLGDNDLSYEDFEITVGGEALYNALYEKYKGNKVRLTMEIIE